MFIILVISDISITIIYFRRVYSSVGQRKTSMASWLPLSVLELFILFSSTQFSSAGGMPDKKC